MKKRWTTKRQDRFMRIRIRLLALVSEAEGGGEPMPAIRKAIESLTDEVIACVDKDKERP